MSRPTGALYAARPSLCLMAGELLQRTTGEAGLSPTYMEANTTVAHANPIAMLTIHACPMPMQAPLCYCLEGLYQLPYHQAYRDISS